MTNSPYMLIGVDCTRRYIHRMILEPHIHVFIQIACFYQCIGKFTVAEVLAVGLKIGTDVGEIFI